MDLMREPWGIPWELLPQELPQELGCGCGMTCWRRLCDWQRAGVWARLHRVLLDRLGQANAIDWGRCSLDSASVPAKRGLSEISCAGEHHGTEGETHGPTQTADHPRRTG